MKKQILLVSTVLLLVMVLNACGPSEEAKATMTASAWTPTPEPTLTPTPLPFDFAITLAGIEGETILMGSVTVNEEEPVSVDENGKLELFNLPGPEVSLVINAQGYEPLEETITLVNGPNQETFTLARDPYQIDPAIACQEGQQVLFIEDFEDKKLQGASGNITRPMWNFIEDEERGTYLQADTSLEGEFFFGYHELFENSVWHFEILREQSVNIISMRNQWDWMNKAEGYGISYILVFENNRIAVQREDKQNSSLGSRAVVPGDGETWEKYSIAFYNGTYELWRNGELYIGVDDDNPHTSGGISVVIDSMNGKVGFDNFIVCSLNELYTPPVVESETE